MTDKINEIMFAQTFVTHEKFKNAVYALTVGPGPINERLFEAWMAITMLSEADVPGDLWPDVKVMLDHMSGNAPDAEPGGVRAALAALGADEAAAIAVGISGMFLTCATRLAEIHKR